MTQPTVKSKKGKDDKVNGQGGRGGALAPHGATSITAHRSANKH